MTPAANRRVGPALVAMTAALAMSQFFRSCLAVMAPELSHDLGLDPAGFGALSSAFFLTFALAQVPVGVAFDRWGTGRPTAALLAIGVLGALVFALAPNGAWAVAGQVGLGLACSPVFMGLIHYAAGHLDERAYLRTISLSNGMGMVGVLAAASPLGWVVQHYGWRAAMLVACGAMALACAAVWRTVRDAGHADAHGQSSMALMHGSLGLLKLPALWALVPVCLAMAAGTTFRNAWGGPYVADVFGLDPISRGSAIAVISVAAFGFAFMLPLAARRWGSLAVIVCMMAAGAMAGLLLALMPDASLSADVVLLAVMAATGTLHPVVMTVGRNAVSPAMRGRALGLLNTFVFLGMAVASAGYGWLVRHGLRQGRGTASVYAGIFLVAAVLMLLSLLPFALRYWRHLRERRIRTA